MDKVALRIEYQSQDAEMKLLGLKKNNELLKRQLEDRSHECISLEDKIQNLKVQVNLSKSVKFSRDEARGGTGGDPVTLAATKMKKVVSRRHMVDTARAQAEEIDYLRQELDKMRQRTFPSFVRYIIDSFLVYFSLLRNILHWILQGDQKTLDGRKC